MPARAAPAVANVAAAEGVRFHPVNRCPAVSGRAAMRAPPVEVPGFAKVMVWHDRTHHDPAHRWLRDLLLRTAQPTAPPTDAWPESRSAP